MGSAIFDFSRLRPTARKILHQVRRARAYPLLHIGQISSTRPLSNASGFDRGTPIDRYYVEQFLSEHAHDIRGCVLETGDASYSLRFGGERVTKQHIIHVDHSNPAATIVGDLSEPGTLPPKTFDCILLTQTLQYVFDVPAAVKQIRDALRPGGVALVTVPGVAPISHDDWEDSFYWRFTATSLERLFESAFAKSAIVVKPFGNLYAATTFLHGAAVQEVNKSKLIPVDPAYAIVICARAVA